jgi:4-diphosphocytidyl-2-C-methyl-D-erythritol kinase
MINPGISVSTADAYRAIDDLKGFTGQEISAEEPERRLFINDFEACTFTGYPEAARLADVMRQTMDAEIILMSGSGPTMIAYYTDAETAAADYKKMLDASQRETGWRVWKTVTGLN